MEEQWKPIEGYEGHYEVSNLGNVRSLDRKILVQRMDKGFTHKVKSHWMEAKGSPLKISRSGTVCLSLNGKQKVTSVNQLVLNHFNLHLTENESVEVDEELKRLLIKCCNVFKVSYKEITSGTRGRLSIMRTAFAYYVSVHHPRFSYFQLADVLGLDRSTVNYNVLKANKTISVDKKLQDYVHLLEREFISNPLVPRSVLFLKELKEKFPDKEEIINFVLEKIK